MVKFAGRVAFSDDIVILVVTVATMMEMSDMYVYFYHEANINIYTDISFPDNEINNILKFSLATSNGSPQLSHSEITMARLTSC